MVFWKIITFTCAASVLVEAKWAHHQKREVLSSICDPIYNNTNKVQCYCINDNEDPHSIRFADCYLSDPTVSSNDGIWSAFKTLNTAQRITFTNTKGIPLSYVPTRALIEVQETMKLEIKYAVIKTIPPYAFANLSSVTEIILRDNQIVTLDHHAFAHHRALKSISLDTNNIEEINRNVFVNLPSLEKLYLTSNQLSTIHDKAFIDLGNLKELEIDRNKVFSLNFASFEGLIKLEKLDLSSNSLEVIGDNTFHALPNLKYLNLEGNKIEMLDEKAFSGLGNLQSLTLARNKLVNIDNTKVFEGLNSLMSLSLRGNKMEELKGNVMAPLLPNFYSNTGSLDVEENNFPCDCRLDWFTHLMNETLNKHLKTTLENLKCYPDPMLREAWNKIEETLKNTAIEDEPETQGADYEYYDETQLNGKLFYVDIRDLLHCNTDNISVNVAPTAITKENTSPTSTSATTSNKVTNQGLLDLSLIDTTTITNEIKADKNKRAKDELQSNGMTTTRLATVSAKPEKEKLYDKMASDQAIADKFNTQRHTLEQDKNIGKAENAKTNDVKPIRGCVMLIVVMVLFRLHF